MLSSFTSILSWADIFKTRLVQLKRLGQYIETGNETGSFKTSGRMLKTEAGGQDHRSSEAYLVREDQVRKKRGEAASNTFKSA